MSTYLVQGLAGGGTPQPWTREQTLAAARAMRKEYERTGRSPAFAVPGLGVINTGDTITFSVPGGNAFSMSLPEIANAAADGAAAIAAIIADPCALWDFAAGAASDALTEWVEELLSNLLFDMLGTLDTIEGSGLSVASFQACQDRVQGDGGTCSDVAVGAAKFAGNIAAKAATNDYAGIITAIVKTIVGAIIASIIALLMTTLMDTLKNALMGALARIGVGAGCTSSGPAPGAAPGTDGGTPGTGPAPAPPPPIPPNPNQAPPIVTQPGGPGSGGGSTTPQPRPPPPMLMAYQKPGIDWMTYLLWGGMGLGVALAASKTLTGAWVPPQVARRAAPVTTKVKAKVKQLRR